jgi:hypothetical protein
MPSQQPRQFTSWSYSRYRDYARCPFFAKCKHLDKIPERESPAMARGIAIGQGTENYLLKKSPKLPTEIHTKLRPLYAQLRKTATLFVEQMWGFNRAWEPVPWNDWQNCHVRIKIDMGYVDTKRNVAVIHDNKSGQFKPYDSDSYMEQLDLYTAGAIAMFPTVRGIETSLVYTDHGITFPEKPVEATPDEARLAQKNWSKKVRALLADKKFVPRPGRYCSWCPYSAKEGGPCVY